MKRFVILGIVACVGLLFAPAGVFAEKPKPVEVINVEPVLVVAPIEAPVNVVDISATPKPVEVVNLQLPVTPTLTPFNAGTHFNQLDTCDSIFVVPEGFTLIIEYVSIGVQVQPESPVLIYDISIYVKKDLDFYAYNLNIPRYQVTVASFMACRGNGQMTKIYVPSGYEVSACVSPVVDDVERIWSAQIDVSGRIIPE